MEEEESQVLIRLESGEDILFEKPKVLSFYVYIPNLRQDFLIERFHYCKQVYKDFYSKLRKLNKEELLTLVVIYKHYTYLDQDKSYKKILTRPKVYLGYVELYEYDLYLKTVRGQKIKKTSSLHKDKPTIYNAIEVLLEQELIQLTKKKEYLLTDDNSYSEGCVGTLLKRILKKNNITNVGL